MARPAVPTKAMQAKKQRVLEGPSAAARQAARLAAHSRHALSLASVHAVSGDMQQGQEHAMRCRAMQ